MTDRELLELAAKAAGYSFWYSKHGYINLVTPNGNTVACCTWWKPFDECTGEKNDPPTLYDALQDHGNWFPLTSDGDALRLAVKLGLDLEMHGCNSTHPYATAFDCERNIAEEEQPNDGDPFAATRRAIVRAAAEIGKALK